MSRFERSMGYSLVKQPLEIGTPRLCRRIVTTGDVIAGGVVLGRRQMLAALGLPLLALTGWRQLAAHDLAASAAALPATANQAGHELLAVTCSRERHLAIVDPSAGLVELIEAGAAPHGLALHPDGRAFVATAEGVDVLDLPRRQRLALVPYSVDVGPPRFGEYRPGGMGIALTPDHGRLAVAVHRPSGPSVLDVLDTARLDIVDSVVVGVRPFQVVAAADSRHVYSIDHDSHTVTVVDLDSGSARRLAAQPLGRGAFDKPHYAALRSDGTLLLPYQGRALQVIDPENDVSTTLPLSAQTHQHGVALTPDERYLLIVGTGPAGGVSGGPSLTILDLAIGAEEIVPLARPHEQVAISRDGRRAYLTGGYLLTGGWDGLTVVDLETRTTRVIAVPGGPLDIAFLP
jgi:DNA-binding beta-propeller fold protein YncE